MKHWVGFAAMAAAASAMAGESEVREGMKRLAPDAVIESVRPSAMAGLYEVFVGDNVVYVSANGDYLLQGRLYDTRQRSDLTAQPENAKRLELLATVKPEQRISFKAANEKHRVTIFTDVDCGYCRKLHGQMSAINAAGVTVDYLMFPRAGMPSASFDKAGYIWCAVDKQDALTASMAAGELDAAKRKNCTHPTEATMKLGQRVAGRIGTPTIIGPDGSILGGYLDPAQLAQRLDALPTTGVAH
jgi:thiol:disulfide interchange protein DsbC